jgi:two-component system C4-dicarboxylate transport response regulator DctD
MTAADPLCLHVLLVEDDPAVAASLAQSLELEGLSVRSFASAEHALAEVGLDYPGVVIADVRLPGSDGLTLLKALLERDSQLPVALMTGHGDIDLAVRSMRAGAYDFLEKPFAVARLIDLARRALSQRRLVLENRSLTRALQERAEHALLGNAPALARIRRMVGVVAGTDVDVLIRGETGTGKEVLARAIHAASGRRGPYVAINCGALPESVFESEIFGHEVGAFTGASRRRIGKLEFAAEGTVLLDEIESMPIGLQVKLLRALQERQVERLGGNATIPLTCRVIAASKADLLQLSRTGVFRADLHFRLSVVCIDLPPLRARREDIPLLFGHFVAQAALRFGLQPPPTAASVLRVLVERDWPGNVRELRNEAERYVLGVLPGIDIDKHASDRVAEETAPDSLKQKVTAFERQFIVAALQRTMGNVVQAAAMLGLPRKTLYDRLKHHRLNADDYRSDQPRQAVSDG